MQDIEYWKRKKVLLYLYRAWIKKLKFLYVKDNTLI